MGAGEGGGMSAADEAKCRKDYVRLRKAWLDRRRTCMEVIGQIGEARGVRDKQLMGEIGLETDEEYGVDKKMKNFPAL